MVSKNKINIMLGGIIARSKATWQSFVIAIFLCMAFAFPAFATYTPFNTNVNMKIGIGTSSPGSNLSVLGGESIGSYATSTAPAGGIIVSGNVGIGSLTPGQVLDVTGTVRATNFVGNGSQLTGINSSQWTTTNTNDVYLPNNGNVGIGTTFITTSALTVMNGNVGIGTWSPVSTMQIVGIGTLIPGSGLVVTNGNVGIGTIIPHAALAVNGALNIQSSSAMIIGDVTGNSPGIYAIDLQTGRSAATNIASGQYSIAMGNNAYAGYESVAIGKGATAGSNWNIAIGESSAGGNNTNVSSNIAIGQATAGGASSETNNISLGNATLRGVDNIAIGYSGNLMPGLNHTNNITIGYSDLYSNAAATSTYNDVIGSGNTMGSTSASNYVSVFGNSNTVTVQNAAVYGNSITNSIANSTMIGYGDTGKITLLNTGNLGIGTINPVSKLNVNGGVGIGTSLTNGAYLNGNSAPSGGLIVQGNVGIGTFNPFGGGLIVFPANTGNVGIGSLTPGQALDVTGTVRATAFIGSGAQLTGINSSQWTTTNTHDVYLPNNGNVGIGTSFTTSSALTVMNGNVGIGTWLPAYGLDMGSGTTNGVTAIALRKSDGTFAGGIGPYTFSNASWAAYSNTGATAFVVNGSNFQIGMDIQSLASTVALSGRSDRSPSVAVKYSSSGGSNGTLPLFQVIGDAGQTADILEILKGANTVDIINSNGNLGIGTITAGNQLVIDGGVGIGTANSSFITSIAPSGGMIVQGNVGIGSLTPGQMLDVTGTVRATVFIGNGSQLTGISSSQWTTTNTNDVYLPNNGNVGIGTTFTTTSALTVMNGNVGIGTWIPTSPLTVQGGVTSIVPHSSATYIAYSPALQNPRALFAVGNNTSDLNAGMYVADSNSSNGLQIPSVLGAVTDQTITDSNEEELVMLAGYTLNGFVQTDLASIQRDAASGTNGLPLVITTQNSFLPGIYVGNTASQNVGIGTSTPVGGLAVMNGNVGIGTWVPGSGLQLKQSFAVYRTPTSASATSAGQTIIGITDTTAARTITLASTDIAPGRVIIIKDESGGAASNNITLTTQGGQTIDGSSSVVITANYGVVRLYSDGTNWFTF